MPILITKTELISHHQDVVYQWKFDAMFLEVKKLTPLATITTHGKGETPSFSNQYEKSQSYNSAE